MESARTRALHEITAWEWVREIVGGIIRGALLAVLGFYFLRGLFWLIAGV